MCVVGAGVMGSATARALARRGRRVALIERFAIGHDRGSSHGSGRIFRFSYPEERYVRMAMESLPMWRALESEAGTRLLEPTGGLDTGPRIGDHLRALTACGARAELLSAAEVEARFGVRTGGDALFQPDGAVVSGDAAWRAFVESAVRHGADLQESTVATGLEADGGAARVVTAGGPVEAAAVVVTAGAWARGLLAGAGIELDTRPTRETVAYFSMPRDTGTPTLVDWGDPAVYALPTVQGLKAGEHQAGPAVDPDVAGPPDPASVARLSAWVGNRFPAAEPRPAHVETCLYTNTADAGFVLERHGRIVVGSPCSGHGFKFAPWIGERLADLAEETV